MVKSKYATEQERKEARNRQKRENEQLHGHANQHKYKKKKNWIYSSKRHKETGFAAQTRYRERKRLEKLEQKRLEKLAEAKAQEIKDAQLANNQTILIPAATPPIVIPEIQQLPAPTPTVQPNPTSSPIPTIQQLSVPIPNPATIHPSITAVQRIPDSSATVHNH